MADMELTDLIKHSTMGKSYCMVVMPFRQDALLFEKVKCVVKEQFPQLECIRADDVRAGSCHLGQKIQQIIRNAAIVIADVTEENSNVSYEVGYAHALGRRVLLMAQQGVRLPTDLFSYEVLFYNVDTRQGVETFQRELTQHVESMAVDRLTMLRSMLLPPRYAPSYILANYLPPKPGIRRPRLRQTFGDYIGVKGIFSAFGALLGAEYAPELLASHSADESVLREDANLFVIGAPRSSPCTAYVLQSIQQGRKPNWRFREPKSEAEGRGCILCGELDGWPASDYDPRRRQSHDYGVIVRGPAQAFPDRMAMVMAGMHPLGTGAACMAATEPDLISRIGQHLPETVQLGDKDRAIWALVRSELDLSGKQLDKHGVRIVAAGAYR